MKDGEMFLTVAFTFQRSDHSKDTFVSEIFKLLRHPKVFKNISLGVKYVPAKDFAVFLRMILKTICKITQKSGELK